MLWHRQAIFESKRDKLSSSAECRIRTQRVFETQSPADWMPADKPTELSRIKLKNVNLTARPYDQQAFSPPDLTAIWHSHLALAIYIFAVVNFDVLAKANDIQIERRQVVFLCWMQDSSPEDLWNPISSTLNACWQTHWAIDYQAKTLAPGSGDIHICWCWFRCSDTGKRFSNRKEISCLPLLNAGFEPRGSLKPNLQQTEYILDATHILILHI